MHLGAVRFRISITAAAGFVSLAMLAAAPAMADQAAADSCARNLSPEAQTIYSAAAPDMTKDAVIRDVLTSHTRELVMSGRVSLTDARSAATAAAECLRELQQ